MMLKEQREMESLYNITFSKKHESMDDLMNEAMSLMLARATEGRNACLEVIESAYD